MMGKGHVSVKPIGGGKRKAHFSYLFAIIMSIILSSVMQDSVLREGTRIYGRFLTKTSANTKVMAVEPVQWMNTWSHWDMICIHV